MSNICPNLVSVTGHDLDVKGSVYLTIHKDNKNFPTRFIICKNFPDEVIIGANFLRTNKFFLDVANSKFVNQTNNKTMINNIKNNRIKEKICNMKDYRQKQIQEISNLWKKFANIERARKDPMDNILNLIKENLIERYYRFLVHKTKIPPKSMQRIQI